MQVLERKHDLGGVEARVGLAVIWHKKEKKRIKLVSNPRRLGNTMWGRPAAYSGQSLIIINICFSLEK